MNDVAAAVPKPGGVRMSCEPDDAGYVPWGMARGDGKIVKVWLDGVEQKQCITADESVGMVKRVLLTPAGNVAVGNDEVLTEVVYGDVRIVAD